VTYADVTDSVTGYSTTTASYTFTREIEGTAALRARAGYAYDRFLPYVTGGAAWGKVEHSFSTSNGVNTFTGRDDDDAYGYQAGAGVDMMVGDGFVVGVEYLYTSLDTEDYTVRSSGPAPATNPFILVNADGTDIRRSDADFDFHSVRATAAYRF
jgi:outer membrane immunogenic protein